MSIYRQGDVLVRKVRAIPAKASEAPREGGQIVLAHGEVTGHKHAISSEHATLYVEGLLRYLRVVKPVALHHEEHTEIKLPPGKYQIVIQREYTPAAIRNVAD